MNVEGIYYVDGDDRSRHCGLDIVEYEGYTYYITYFFNVLENKDLYVDYAWLISNEEAFKIALGRDNIELCRLIDSFKVGLSNIKENKRMMLDKKENLLKTDKGN